MSNDSIQQGESAWVQSTKTAFDIVDVLRERDGAGVTELARALDLSKSAVHKHLQTLLMLGYVAKDGTEYRLGIRFLSLGAYTMQQQLVAFGDVRTGIDTLAQNARMTAFLAVPDGDDGVVLYASSASGTPRFRQGDRFFLPTTAAGRTILAHLPDDRRDAALSGFDDDRRADLESEFRHVRDRRIVFDRGAGNEWRSVAAPVLDEDERPIGAVAASGPDDIVDKRLSEDVAGLVLSTAKSVRGDAASSAD
ncbi:IclR family transcriptional regulator [Halosolutus gelatinilyticus]|uniref:IclR family transcriptional regulator n=1 Tax=Halosolutus gelatinilyticus TaxID=2931975 RepID=UPI001FF35B4D|nr:IclR family transcriptional regulator [Halosolutus gelatinilyticus]